MALKTRMILLWFSRMVVMASSILLVSVYLAQAGGESAPSSSGIMWQIITGLLALLQTVFMGIGVWIISNQSEMFRRIGNLESDNKTRAALCDERHK